MSPAEAERLATFAHEHPWVSLVWLVAFGDFRAHGLGPKLDVDE